MSIKLEGLDALFESLDSIADVNTVENALNDSCLIVERAARQKAPKSIAPTIESNVDGLEGIVFTPLEYAPYVEYGTGLYAENGNGRKDVPWVYVEGEGSGSVKSTKKYASLDEAKKSVRYLREKGLDAYYTYGQHPQPYMRPALNENRDLILKIIKEGLTNG